MGIPDLHPLLIMGIGIVTVLGLIIFLKVNAFIALITAAIVVSLLAPGDIANKIGRVASAFGGSAGSIGIVIAMAAVIGKCMLDSGAADRVVRAFLNALGEKRSPVALMGSGFVLAVPVFFDTVFYLLVPLARSLFRKTKSNYLLYILAISAGGAVTHTLVPPTPGPLLMASNLSIDLGTMILIGALVGLPASIAGLVCSKIMNRVMPIEMRAVGSEPEPEPLDDSELPSLILSLAPVLLPVIMISGNTVATTIADANHVALLQSADDIPDWPAFRQLIRDQAAQGEATPGGRIVQVLGAEGPNQAAREETLALINRPEALSGEDRTQLTDGLNRFILADKYFYNEQAFLGVPLSGDAKSLLGKERLRMKLVDIERLNREVLESTYGDQIADYDWNTPERKLADVTSLLGDANLALLLSAVIAILVLKSQRGLSLTELAKGVETALMSGGVIILITAAGGAFGAMLAVAGVGPAIQSMVTVESGGGASSMYIFLTLGFVVSAVFKVAQGSSTVAMITVSGMLVGIAQPAILGCNPVYLATAIGGGSLVGSWMNDSGFWIFAKMGGLTEVEALKTWTPMLVVLGCVSYAMSLFLATVLPLLP
jgi:H+/gluconate symporter-like permease